MGGARARSNTTIGHKHYVFFFDMYFRLRRSPTHGSQKHYYYFDTVWQHNNNNNMLVKLSRTYMRVHTYERKSRHVYALDKIFLPTDKAILRDWKFESHKL